MPLKKPNKKVTQPSCRYEMATQELKSRSMSMCLACAIFFISQMCCRYAVKLSTDNEPTADWLVSLPQNQRNWGFGLCFSYLRNVKGFDWNHKWVYSTPTTSSRKAYAGSQSSSFARLSHCLAWKAFKNSLWML